MVMHQYVPASCCQPNYKLIVCKKLALPRDVCGDTPAASVFRQPESIYTNQECVQGSDIFIMEKTEIKMRSI